MKVNKVQSASLPDRRISGTAGYSAVVCFSRGGRSAGCREVFSEDTEFSSALDGPASASGNKLHAEEKDAFAIHNNVLDDGMVAVCSTRGVLREHGGAESDFSEVRAAVPRAAVSDVFGSSGEPAVPESAAHSTAGESEEIIGLHVSPSSLDNSSNSCGCVAAVACARLPAVPGVSARVCSVSSSSAVSAAVAHARFTPMHDAHNSWSDTGRVTGPTGTKRVKGGVSGPAEDLRPVSEVEAGVNFRPAGGVRGQVAGSLSRRQPGTGTRRLREGVVTPSLHPEVPGIQFVSPGRGLDIRQSMGWTKVCETARSGIWVLKGNARTRMLPENLDHLPVRWISRGTYETAWVTPGHDCLCSYQYGHGAAVRPQTNDAIWRGVIGFVGQGRAPLVTLVWQEGIANGCELEPVLRSKFMYSLA